jgi:hypothetical protein
MYIVMDRIGIACGKGERADLGGLNRWTPENR